MPLLSGLESMKQICPRSIRMRYVFAANTVPVACRFFLSHSIWRYEGMFPLPFLIFSNSELMIFQDIHLKWARCIVEMLVLSVRTRVWSTFLEIGTEYFPIGFDGSFLQDQHFSSFQEPKPVVIQNTMVSLSFWVDLAMFFARLAFNDFFQLSLS